MKTPPKNRLLKILSKGIILAVLLISCLGGTQCVRRLGILPADIYVFPNDTEVLCSPATPCDNQRGLESVDDMGNAILQFASGFEGSTHITGEISTGSGKNNWIEGVDGPLGDWSSLKTGNYDNLDWAKQAYGWFEGGRMEIVQDPTGNQVLRMRNTVGGRSQWQLNQAVFWNDDGTPNKFTQQFYRYRMYIPSDITTVFAYSAWSEWYMIWENHTWDGFSGGNQTRGGIYLQKHPNSDLWYFRVVMTRPGGCDTYAGPTSSCQVYWDNKVHQSIPVPFDQWFTFDVFFKYSETDGEWYVAITRDGQPRQEIAHYIGPTQFNGEKLHDQMIMKLYHDSKYLSALGETTQYYDDLEIWSDFPPGYFTPGVVIPSLTPTLTIMPSAPSMGNFREE